MTGGASRIGLLLDTDELRRRVLDGWIGLYNPYPAEAVDLFHGNRYLKCDRT
jgi:hypothetical protein